MALKPVKFPAVYERLSPERTPEEIESDMNSRFSAPASEARTVASTPLAPPPPDREVAATKTIGKQPLRRKATGRPPVNRPESPSCRPQQHDWYGIGKSRTPGKVRRRCVICRREETVPESEAPPRINKIRKPRKAKKA